MRTIKILPRLDKNGVALQEGDIVAEGSVGDLIWGDTALIERRPLGIVQIIKNPCCTLKYPPEETDFYNIYEIRPGMVSYTNNSPQWLTQMNTGGALHISRYDGRFYNWDNIEKVGSIYDLPD